MKTSIMISMGVSLALSMSIQASAFARTLGLSDKSILGIYPVDQCEYISVQSVESTDQIEVITSRNSDHGCLEMVIEGRYQLIPLSEGISYNLLVGHGGGNAPSFGETARIRFLEEGAQIVLEITPFDLLNTQIFQSATTVYRK